MRKIIGMCVIMLILVGVYSYKTDVQAEEVVTKELYTLVRPVALDKAGLSRGIYHDRQDLGIIMPAGEELEIRQVNPNYKDTVSGRFITADSKEDSTFQITSSWGKIKNNYTAVPFIYTSFRTDGSKEKPVLEYRVTNKMKKLPIYQANNNETAFFQLWDSQDAEYGLVLSDKFQMIVPKKDKELLRKLKDFKNIDDVISYYNQVITLYCKLDGLSLDAKEDYNRDIATKFFIRANKSGGGYMYYGGEETAENNDSLAGWLYKGWGPLHEIGHAYQGPFMSGEVSLGEVWNNIYAASFEEQYMGDDVFQKGTIYGTSLKSRTNEMIQSWKVANLPISKWSGSSKEQTLMAMKEKAGDEAFAYFNQQYRKLTSQADFNAADYPIFQVLNKFYGEKTNFDFTPFTDSIKAPVSNAQKEQNRSKDYRPVASIVDVIPDSKRESVKQQLKLKTDVAIVDNDQIASLGLKGNVTVNFDIADFKDIKGKHLKLSDGKKIVKDVIITNPTMKLDNLPNGVYTIEDIVGNTSNYNMSEHYVFVKDAENNLKVTFTKITGYKLIDRTIDILGCDYVQAGKLVTDLKNNKVIVDIIAETPHPRYENKVYYTIEIFNEKKESVFKKEIQGTNVTPGSYPVAVKPGYQIKIVHDEPQLLRENGVTISTTNKTLVYTVTTTGLVKNDTIGLDRTIDIFGCDYVQAGKLVTDLKNNKVIVDIIAETPHWRYANKVYYTVEILNEKQESIFKKEIEGTNVTPGSNPVTVKPGYQIKIVHDEPQLLRENGVNIPTSNKTVLYTVTEMGLVRSDLVDKSSTVDRIAKLAKTIDSNDGYYETRGQILETINLFPEAQKQDLLEQYQEILQPLLDKKAGTTDFIGDDFQFSLLGLSNNKFASIDLDLANNKAKLWVRNGQPQLYFTNAYATIQLKDEFGNVIYSQDYIGNISNPADVNKTFDVKPGYYISVMHREADSRLQMKNTESNEIIPSQTENHFKITATGLQIVKKEDIPKPTENQIKYYGQQYDFSLYGLGNNKFASIGLDLANKQAKLWVRSGQPHVYFQDSYATIKIEDATGNVIFTKDFLGNVANTELNKTLPIESGSLITIMHREAAERLAIQDVTTGSKLLVKQTVTYKVTSTGLHLIASK
ncbi:hypothetical protein HCJ57_14665 [Listeria booriae]|uniref:Uncharacterized protein n=1 Tax=Listeria booriae TaxID=1552123 RepID=A0A099WIB8_9LIST|nr:putative mucin/carbohydrate-binding domain-containing protein [Listeria booriae]KGL44293.1 hypothetical protein EP57_01480 [Listeria booriae]MBC1892845.1 hypothetical protein [Listeria booriae]MBC1913870.1 hypothetical protein [Listeria booriae]MBC2057765.1 hypothetical protein [Listeria booriae]MBC2069162.1 hypothetical protein [Listeria booriae]